VCPVRIVTNEIVVQISLGQLESVVVEDVVIPIPSGQKIPSFQNKTDVLRAIVIENIEVGVILPLMVQIVLDFPKLLPGHRDL
jgi:hypothetical protein